MRSITVLLFTIVVLGCSTGATENPSIAPAMDPNRLTGTVLETLDVASYTYVRLQASGGEAWAAVPRAELEVGTEVAIENPQAMANFESKTLGRQFETIYFGTLADQAPGSPIALRRSSPHESKGGATRSMGGGMGGPEASAGPIEVAKAEGESGRTVAELYTEKADLVGKTVALRGKVVKYNAGIMGRSWIHLQDGTGDANAGTHDITVTSSDTTAVGDIIVVEGVVAVDKDFGAGYRYPVIVEDARVQ